MESNIILFISLFIYYLFIQKRFVSSAEKNQCINKYFLPGTREI